MTPPCKRDCPDRSPTCHCTCEKYKAYAEQKRGERKVRYEASKAMQATCEGTARKKGYKPQV